MRTNELSLAGAPALGEAAPALGASPLQPELAGAPLGGGAEAGVGRLLEQLANAYFAGVPGPALELGRQQAPGLPIAVSGAPAPGPVAPPSGVFPSATSIGALGISPGAGWVPPPPGFMQSPPLASGPLPDEADLRTVPAMLSEGLGISSPVGLARGLDANPEGAPYFLDLAGLPKASLPSPAAAGVGAVPAAPATPGLGWAAPAVPGGAALPERVPPVTSVPLVAPPSAASAAGLAPAGPGGSLGFLELAGLPKAYGGNGTPAVSAFKPSAAGVLPMDGAAAAPSAAGAGVPAGPATSSALASSAPTTVGGTTSPERVPPVTSVPLAPASVASAAAVAPADPGSAPSIDAPAGGFGYDARELSLVPYGVDAPSFAGTDAPKLERGGRRQFDAASVRRDFPILKERVHGRELVWLDNAATTQKPRAVIERISYFYEHENSNIHRAAHTLAARATDAYEGARETTRRFINAASTKEIIFVRGTTEAINLVAQTWGRRNLVPGDEVVITWLEHHANIVPWQQIASERGARLKVAPVDDQGQVLLYEYEKLLGSRTKIVSLSHVSNALGTIVPVTEMVSMAHRYGAKVLVDGAQAVSHMPVDVQAIDADFYVFSGHKIFGPTGIGALFGKAEVLEHMPPWQGGGNMIRDVTFERTQFQDAPARFEAGTPNIADAVGLGAALDYVSALGIENISRYEHDLLEYATPLLLGVPGLRLYGTAPDKAGVMSFTLDGLKTEEIGVALDRQGIAVRAGHHCAQPILRRLGVESTVRASLAPYNTCEDIDALVSALHQLRARPY
jgi:cysteine desulfurase / selenocysteine lyase